MQLELQKAKRKWQKARKMYQQHRYFDCLEQVSDALECFNTNEFPNANLKANNP